MNESGPIFLIDDEESMRLAVSQWLSLADYHVDSFASGSEALEKLSEDFAGVVVSDIRMPGMDGMELLEAIVNLDREIPVVLITAHGDIPMAVTAIRSGAYDFLEKPFEPDLLLETVRRAHEKRQLVLENRNLRQQLESGSTIDRLLLGNSEPMQMVRREIHDLGPTDASVFLVGETGCGKEVVARCLHEISERRGGPFVAINCGAIPESLFESELFGHEAGAFTGAQNRRIGKFETANGGTLFLDEVTAMPPNLQVKVLRVLQEREIERLGGNKSTPIDIRIISATNSDPRQDSADGTFREDLYYRLNVAEIHIPPLRQRSGDIMLLFEYFVMLAADKYRRTPPPLPPETVSALMVHSWPGNVRELKNIAERHVLSSLPPRQRIGYLLRQGQSSPIQVSGHTLAEQAGHFEKCVIEQALRRHDGNITEVMAELDLPRRTLNQKMQNHGIRRKDFVHEKP